MNGPIFANGMIAPSSYLPLLNPAEATLAAGSLALDKGRVLPNLNDGYRGAAPDLGALELGCPSPSYGPRPEGTDERNEVIGCDADSSVTAIQVLPATVTLAALQTKEFTASGGSVTWQINPARGTITPSGLYTAPSDALLGEQVTLTARSVSDPSVTGSAMITLTAPVSIAVTPSAAPVVAGGSRQFTATVSGAVNRNVQWVLNPAVGALSSSGLYTAPLSIPSSQAVNVTAVSDADTTKFASGLVTLTPGAGISVTVSPATVAMNRKGTRQFQASVTGATNPSVTWSISPSVGRISQNGRYRAPNKVDASVSVTVTATNAQDGAATGTALITFPAPAANPR